MRSPSMRTSTRDPPREEVAAARNTSATMERDLEEEEEEEVEEIMSGSTWRGQNTKKELLFPIEQLLNSPLKTLTDALPLL